MNYLTGLAGIFCLLAAMIMAPLGLLPMRPPPPENLHMVDTRHCQIQNAAYLKDYFLCHAAAHQAGCDRNRIEHNCQLSTAIYIARADKKEKA